MQSSGISPNGAATGQTVMQSEQYASSKNLDARIVLHERFSTNKYGWYRKDVRTAGSFDRGNS